ncbi:hypothetical protein CON22_24995 [Bacillus cereus]|nr:hypothetical protein CON22_24995 [Bacillus cereus]
MENWMKDDKWKVVFPEEKVFIMKHHNWAFVAWDLARDKGWIKDNATLIHVDQHLDAAIDGAMVPGIKKARGIEELSKLTKERYGSTDFVGTDNFIWAGFARETVQTIVYVSPEDPREPLFDSERQFRNLQGALNEERIKELFGVQWDSLEMLKDTKERGIMDVFTSNHSLILDLDLDFFAYKTETETGNTVYVLKDESEIRRSLKTLKEIYNWDIITVALSPEDCHIGGTDNALYVLNLFLEGFNLDINKGNSWSILEEGTHK